MAQIATATVKFEAREPKETQYGPRVNAVLTLDSGEEIKVWGNPGDPVQFLRKGERVQVVKGKKGWDLGETTADTAKAPTANNPKGFETPAEDARKSMVSYIDFSAKMHRHCYDKALEQYTNEAEELLVSEREVMATATTLFIQAMRRFNP